MAEAVKVIVRCRPMNAREKDLNCAQVVTMDGATGACSIVNPADKKPHPKNFTFDGAYFTDSTTEQIYNDVAYPLVESVTEGYNGTIFAYGQTGCGKSFSMQGITDPKTQRGIIPRAFDHIFETISVSDGAKYLVHASYLEIYNEDVRDLLGKDTKQKLELKEHPEKGVYVQGLSMNTVHNVTECQHVMETGWKNRSVGATLMNADSSRSHSIFTINLERCETDESGEEHIRAGKLNLVDLAGSERQTKTGATGDRLKEATKINLSLSALGNVISALVDGKSKHIPYRDSKLTRLLQDSLGGNTKTLMVACLSPADNNYDETLSTLRYANRAKNIKNKPKINEDPKDALLRQFQEEIEVLKAMLMGKIPVPEGGFPAGGTVALPPGTGEAPPKTIVRKESVDLEAEKAKLKEEFDQQLEELKAKYEEEKDSNAKLQEDMDRLRTQYESNVAEVETHYMEEFEENKENLSKTSLKGDSRATLMSVTSIDSVRDVDQVDSSTEAYQTAVHLETNNVEGEEDDQEGVPAPSSSPTGEIHNQQMMLNQEEALKRLAMLQQQMVGGEAVNNQEIKERRKKRKKHAEEKKKKLAEANSNMEDDNIMLNIYDSIQDELKATKKLYEKEKDKNETLQTEITDLQSEFEFDRIDYLDTIRSQERELKLLQSIIDKIHPCIRRDCNYSNLDKIRAQCVWDPDNQKWVLPQLFIEKTSLPQGGIQPGGRVLERRHQRMMNGESNQDVIDDRLYQKLRDKEDMSSDYFKPKRANMLLSQTQERNARNTSPKMVNGSAPWIISNPPNALDGLRSPPQMTDRDLRAAEVHGQIGPDDVPKKPARLQALRQPSAKKPKKKKQNMLEPI